jgi:hypothetical protein
MAGFAHLPTDPASLVTRPRFPAAGVVYEGLVAGLAFGGAVTHDRRWWIALLAVTWLLGVAGIVAVYASYGIVSGLGHLVGARMSASGYGPHWFVVIDGVVVVACWLAVGAGNVAVVTGLLRRRWEDRSAWNRRQH